MTKIYLCGSYARRAELQGYADTLRGAGHLVMSRWLLGPAQPDDGVASLDMRPGDAANYADGDLADIRRSEAIIAFTEAPGSKYSRGGRHVELGYALAYPIRIYIVGPRENIFMHLPGVMANRSFDECFREHFGGDNR